jgi:hypothetical protein
VAPTPARFAERKVVCARCYALEHYGCVILRRQARAAKRLRHTPCLTSRVKSETAEALLPAFDFEAIVGGKLRRAAARTRPGKQQSALPRVSGQCLTLRAFSGAAGG